VHRKLSRRATHPQQSTSSVITSVTGPLTNPAGTVRRFLPAEHGFEASFAETKSRMRGSDEWSVGRRHQERQPQTSGRPVVANFLTKAAVPRDPVEVRDQLHAEKDFRINRRRPCWQRNAGAANSRTNDRSTT